MCCVTSNDALMTTNELQAQWGQRLRAARERKGFSLRTLAAFADIDKGQLSRAENGAVGLGDELRIRIASALGRRVEDLFPYPDTTDQETPCPSAASAPDEASSPTPATTEGTRSPARSAAAPAPSARAASPSTEGDR